MAKGSNSKIHHWWPVALQQYWCDRNGDISWLEPGGNIQRKKAANRRIGYKRHGHTASKGTVWESNFEGEFSIDNEVHNIITGCLDLKPLGQTPSEFSSLLKLFQNKGRPLRDRCRFYQLDEQLHRNLLLFLHSLLIRSPACRSKYESYPRIVGMPHDEDVGKANMAQTYGTAKELCLNGPISNQYFVLLHSPQKSFTFGDGVFDWLTDALFTNRISGRALVPLTPRLCVNLCAPFLVKSTQHCASIYASPWMVDAVNEITQIYSRDKLFFLGETPSVTRAFSQRQFFVHREKSDPFFDRLDEIMGV